MATDRARFEELWPLARVRARGPRVELRLPSDDELFELVDVARAGVHEPEAMPFASPWTQHDPATVARRMLAWHWSQRAACAPESWNLLFVAYVDGRPVGAQDLAATDFATRRAVTSGSWLGRAHQGRGLGTEMREALLALAFDGFGARLAESGAYEDNAASVRVSEKCGYEPNGVNEVVRSRGPLAPGGESREAATELRFRLTAERWRARTDRPRVELAGVDDDVRALLGLARG